MSRRPEFRFASRRSPVYAAGGMVAASQPLAVSAGLEILRLGGTAADASVAVAAALAVTEPCSTGLGGDAFALYYDCGSSQVYALNGSGRSPAALTLDLVRERGFASGLPDESPLAVTVPGACAAWCDLAGRFGSMDLAEVLAPAIRLAREGFPVAPVASEFWSRFEELMREAPGGQTFLNGEGCAPMPGEVFINRDLAATLEGLARAESPQAARHWFYAGEPGLRVAEAVRDAGGVLSEEDMGEHRSRWDTAVETEFMGARVLEHPPNGQGLAALLALAIVREYEAARGREALGAPGSAKRLHLLIEAMRLAFADAMLHVADMDLYAGPYSRLLSADYARERAALVDPGRAAADVRTGVPREGSETVQFVVLDGQGNACSMVNSNYKGFGAGITPEGLGFSLQNRGLGFDLDPDHPNVLAPVKRPYHTIIPGMLLRADGSLLGPFGVMGKYMQPQGHLQVVSHLLLDGMDPQAALDEPRFCIDIEADGTVFLEEGVDRGAAKELEGLGHRLVFVSGYERDLFGRGQIVLRDPDTGVLAAGSDPRADGLAVGL